MDERGEARLAVRLQGVYAVDHKADGAGTIRMDLLPFISIRGERANLIIVEFRDKATPQGREPDDLFVLLDRSRDCLVYLSGSDVKEFAIWHLGFGTL